MANVPKFFIFSLLCHVLFFLSVFEIHFKSPIIHGMTDVQVDWFSAEPRAKRIVIFIADGLRYDKWQEFIALQPSSFMARTSKGDHCSVGISNTRVPTETRPGHVALLAGIYEDPSAVFRGWQDNPVDFDSVLNKSSTSVSWGAPDVVLMFRKGGAERHSKFYAYDHDTVDFAEKNASITDAWVFNEVQKFFEYGGEFPASHQQGVVFLLHLLGMDLVGHNKKPHSKDYMDCLTFVDRGIKQMVQLFQKIYPDNRTVFLITADHGMTDWGSHGSGSDAETHTPLMIFGEPWATTSELFVNQADIAPTISALVGNPLPVNSVGFVPFTNFRHAYGLPYAVKVTLTNALQLLSQVEALEQMHASSISYRSFPFRDLEDRQDRITRIKVFIRSSNFEKAAMEIISLRSLAAEALEYYQFLRKPAMMLSVLCSYVIWLGIVGGEIIAKVYDLNRATEFGRYSQIFCLLAIGTAALLFLENSELSSYVYFCLPFLLLSGLVTRETALSEVRKVVTENRTFGLIVTALVCSWYGCFTYRPTLMCSAVILSVWPWKDPSLKSSTVTHLKCNYSISSLLLGAFALTPVVGKISDYGFVYAGCVLCSIILGSRSKYGILRSVAFIVCGLNVLLTVTTVDLGRGSPFVSRVLSWGALTSIVPVCFTKKDERELNFLTALSCVFLLLSIRHEAIFLPILIYNCKAWRSLEFCSDEQLYPGPIAEKSPDFRQIRRPVFLVIYALLAFFGTGNLASINSFDPTAVYCFVTIFSPFVMTLLLLIKIMIPVCVVMLTFSSISAGKDNFLIVMFLCDVMSLLFFCSVRATGSWLDIGTSISHYVISLSLTLFLLVLHQVCMRLIGFWELKQHAA